jgi:FkbM family methyltransferase
MNEWIYDVGVNDGADSAYYLFRGYRVLGIEASPILAGRLKERFSKEIQEGRYTLLEVGIADQAGSGEFWMSDVTEWSSFNKAIASRNNTPHKAVQVPIRTFASVVDEFGVPFYCKVDIEGNDKYCLTGLTEQTAPRYFSIEMSHKDGGDQLDLLHHLGYRHFKIISQATRAPAMPLVTRLYGTIPEYGRKALRFSLKNTLGVSSHKGWKFRYGSSGSFGEDTPGKWQSLKDAKALWLTLKEIDERSGRAGLGEWFDFHARKGE